MWQSPTDVRAGPPTGRLGSDGRWRKWTKSQYIDESTEKPIKNFKTFEWDFKPEYTESAVGVSGRVALMWTLGCAGYLQHNILTALLKFITLELTEMAHGESWAPQRTWRSWLACYCIQPLIADTAEASQTHTDQRTISHVTQWVVDFYVLRYRDKTA